MKRTIVALALLTSNAFLLSCNQDETAFGSQTAHEFHASISGKVTDRSGRPMVGAMVTARPGGATGMTNSDGKFVLEGVSSGSYRIEVAKDDYRDTMWLDSVRVGLSEARDVGTIGILYRFATVTGVVVDTSGSVQSRAGIAVEDQTPTVTASGDGKFVLDRIEPGPVRLFSAVQNVGYGTLDTILRPDDTLKNVRLKIVRRGGVVVGYIIDTDGKPVVNALVEAMGGALKAKTDDQGRFEMSEVPSDGKVLVEVSENGRTATVTGVRVGEASRTSIDTIRIASAADGEALVVLPGLALGFTTDSVVALVVTTASSDTSFHVRRYLWSGDNGSTWDTTTVNVLPLQPKRLGWGEGTHPVLVKVVALDGRVSPTTTMFVRLIPPPDWTSPVVKRISPSRDTTLSWNDSSLTLSWRITDNRKVDSVWIGGLLVSGSGDVYSRKVDLVVGRSAVSLRARDVAGNVARDSLVLTRRGLNAQDTLLDSLKISKGKLSPSFAKETLSYADTVSSSDSTVTVSAWASDTSVASVWIGDSKTNSRSVNLGPAGSSTQVRVFVIAKDGDTLEYDVSVWRPSASSVVQDSTFGIPWNSAITYGVLSDSRDGQSYRTVKIGTQTWMAENLNYKGSGKDSGRSYNNKPDTGAKYGRLYTWATTMGLPDSCNNKVCASQVQAKRQGICPSGWHVPSDAEWNTLKNASGDSSTVGTKLKSAAGWLSSGNGIDTYGFRTLPGGYAPGNSFDYVGTDAYLYSATEINATYVWFHGINYGYSGMARNNIIKANGLSVRCIEDVTVLDTSTTLTGLSVDSGTITPNFNSETLVYTDTVSSSLTSLKVTATASSTSATITYNGSASNVVAILRDTVINVKVTNGTGSRTYKIYVYHKPIFVTKSDFDIPWNDTVTYGALYDARDGQRYRTVMIRGMNWMAENLNYKVDSSWWKDGKADSGQKYGRLYSWTAALDLPDSCSKVVCASLVQRKRQGACPVGWHVPSDSEWTAMLTLMSQNTAGTNIKSTAGWMNQGNGTDDHGFRALPLGYKYGVVASVSTGVNAFWWSASEYSPTIGYTRAASSTSAYMYRGESYNKNYGLGLRCVDNAEGLDTSTALASFSLASGTLSPKFDPSIVEYSDTVSDLYSLTILAVTASASATISYNGSPTRLIYPSLDSASRIVVTNSGRSRTYLIKFVKRPVVVEVAPPVFSPVPGVYARAQNVTLSTTTVGATIFYTTDRTAPTTNSKQYTGAIPVSSSMTIYAIAVNPGMTNSLVVGGAYPISSGVTLPISGLMKLIPASTFRMGSPSTVIDSRGNTVTTSYLGETQHTVSLSAFYIDVNDVTQAEYQSMMGVNPASATACGSSCPVVNVTWYDAALYCNARSKRMGLDTVYSYTSIDSGFSGSLGSGVVGITGIAADLSKNGYRLPTEAQWEFAARGNTSSTFWSTFYWGDASSTDQVSKYAWYVDNSGSKMHPVGTKLPNDFGLYDMAGNVSQWIHDYDSYYSTTAQTDPSGPATGSARVYRGSDYSSGVQDLRSAVRGVSTPGNSYQDMGFRCVRPGS